MSENLLYSLYPDVTLFSLLGTDYYRGTRLLEAASLALEVKDIVDRLMKKDKGHKFEKALRDFSFRIGRLVCIVASACRSISFKDINEVPPFDFSELCFTLNSIKSECQSALSKPDTTGERLLEALHLETWFSPSIKLEGCRIIQMETELVEVIIPIMLKVRTWQETSKTSNSNSTPGTTYRSPDGLNVVVDGVGNINTNTLVTLC